MNVFKKHKLWNSVAHVAEKLNTEADKQSRKLKDDIESPLKTDLFEKLRNIVETMDK